MPPAVWREAAYCRHELGRGRPVAIGFLAAVSSVGRFRFGVGVRVDDILTGGVDRGPAWRRRGLLAGVVVVVAGVVVLRHLPGEQRRPADRALPPVVSGEPLPRIMPGRAGVPGEADRPQFRLMRGIRLPVAGPRPFWFWPATGRAEPIGGLPVTGASYSFVRVVGGWVVMRGALARPACSICMGAPLPVYFVADRASAARWVGIADAVAPAATARGLWLTSYRQGGYPGHAAVTAREVGADGRSLGPAVRLPAGYAIAGATGRGLLLAPAAPRGIRAALLLWNPGAGQVGRRFGAVLAVSARQIAWMPRCARRCVVKVADVVTGRVIAVRQQAGQVAISATFSPDGSYLAVQADPDFAGTGGGEATRLYIVSLRTGQVAAVPGTRASGGALVGFGWPDNTDTLVAELSFPAKVQLAAWHPGGARPEVVAVEPGQGAAGLVLG